MPIKGRDLHPFTSNSIATYELKIIDWDKKNDENSQKTKIAEFFLFRKLKLKIEFVHFSSDCLHILSYLPYTSQMTNDLV